MCWNPSRFLTTRITDISTVGFGNDLIPQEFFDFASLTQHFSQVIHNGFESFHFITCRSSCFTPPPMQTEKRLGLRCQFPLQPVLLPSTLESLPNASCFDYSHFGISWNDHQGKEIGIGGYFLICMYLIINFYEMCIESASK